VFNDEMEMCQNKKPFHFERVNHVIMKGKFILNRILQFSDIV
jgi:hypothetical protein